MSSGKFKVPSEFIDETTKAPIEIFADNDRMNVRLSNDDKHYLLDSRDDVLVNPMEEEGDIIVGGKGGLATRVERGQSGQILRSTEYGIAWDDETEYILPSATEDTLGGIKVGERLTVTNGVLSADEQQYELPIATANTIGGIKPDNETIFVSSDGTLSTTTGNMKIEKYITNCILESFGDVISSFGSTYVDIRQSTRLLMPNGRSQDGTFNNLNVTFDIQRRLTVESIGEHDSNRFLFLVNNGDGTFSSATNSQYNVVVSSSPPTILDDMGATVDWFNQSTNTWKRTTDGGQSWETKAQIVLARYDCDSSGITAVYSRKVTEIFNSSDAARIASFSMPGKVFVDITVGESEAMYTSPVTGWVTVEGTAAQSSSRLTLKNETNGITNSESTYSSNSYLATCLPVLAGDTFSLTYSRFGDNIPQLRLIYSEGNTCI